MRIYMVRPVHKYARLRMDIGVRVLGDALREPSLHAVPVPKWAVICVAYSVAHRDNTFRPSTSTAPVYVGPSLRTQVSANMKVPYSQLLDEYVNQPFRAERPPYPYKGRNQ